jgi:hypothetical protein
VSKGHCHAELCEEPAEKVNEQLGHWPFCKPHEGVFGDEWDRCTVSTCYRWAVLVGEVALCGLHGGRDFLGGGDQ